MSSRGLFFPPKSTVSETGCKWIKGLAFAGAYSIAIVAIIVAIMSMRSASFITSQTVYDYNGELSSSTSGQVLAAPTGALAMTLPSNLVEYVGKTFYVECVTPFAHTVHFQSGPTWDGVSTTTATCEATPGSGFSFRVISHNPPMVRVLYATQVSFA